MTSLSKTEILHNWFDQVWCQGNLAVIENFLAPDIAASGVVPPMKLTREEFASFMTIVRSQLERISVEVTHTIEQGDWLAARVAIQGIATRTGERIATTGQLMVRFENGKMAEAYNEFDYISILEQLGQLPEDTIAVCLTGQSLDWR